MGRFHTVILAISPFVSFSCFCLEAHEKPVEASDLRLWGGLFRVADGGQFVNQAGDPWRL